MRESCKIGVWFLQRSCNISDEFLQGPCKICVRKPNLLVKRMNHWIDHWTILSEMSFSNLFLKAEVMWKFLLWTESSLQPSELIRENDLWVDRTLNFYLFLELFSASILQDLARFLQDSRPVLASCKILQDKRHLQESCKILQDKRRSSTRVSRFFRKIIAYLLKEISFSIQHHFQLH